MSPLFLRVNTVCCLGLISVCSSFTPFSSCILLSSMGPISGQHRVADLMLASLIAALTFKVAYRASLVLGTVLLQTSPPRGLSNGKMEAFLRAMREVCPSPNIVDNIHNMTYLPLHRLNVILKLYISQLHISGSLLLALLHTLHPSPPPPPPPPRRHLQYPILYLIR